MSDPGSRYRSAFPLPLLPPVPSTAATSRAAQQRNKANKAITNCCNLAIAAFNSIHSPSRYKPFHPIYNNGSSVFHMLYTTDYQYSNENQNSNPIYHCQSTWTQQYTHIFTIACIRPY